MLAGFARLLLNYPREKGFQGLCPPPTTPLPPPPPPQSLSSVRFNFPGFKKVKKTPSPHHNQPTVNTPPFLIESETKATNDEDSCI